MVRQSRLRVQKGKKRWRALLFVLFITIITFVYWQVDRKFETSLWIKNVVAVIEKSLSEDSAIRGAVYDRNLKQVAVTKEKVSVYARTKEISSIPEVVRKLGVILPVDADGLRHELETGPLRVWVAENISQEQEEGLKELQLPGIYLQREQIRFYPNDINAAHLIGYVEDNMGLAGVEFYYDRLLSKSEPEKILAINQIRSSPDLLLTLDLKIQRVLEKLVTDIGGWHENVKVGAYVVEATTGEIVGGAQFPSFNPNNFRKYSHNVLQNIFLTTTVIPDKFRQFLRDAAGIYSDLEVGLMPYPWSIGTMKQNLGSQLRLWERLGLTERWSTDFTAYNQSDKKTASPYGPLLIAQRQSYGLVPDHATPLQILIAMSAIINSGEKITPHAVAAVVDVSTGKKYQVAETLQKSNIARDVVNNAVIEVGYLLNSQASKSSSGTLMLRDSNLIVSSSVNGQQFLVSEMMFVAIPADRTPLTMLLVVEREAGLPKVKLEGAAKSLETRVGQIVEHISVLQQVAKSVSDVVEVEELVDGNYPLEQPGSSIVFNGKKIIQNKLGSIGVMPDVSALSLRKSLQLLQKNNLNIRIQGSGRVVSQKPLPGTPLKGLSECLLILEKGEDMRFEKMTPVGS